MSLLLRGLLQSEVEQTLDVPTMDFQIRTVTRTSILALGVVFFFLAGCDSTSQPASSESPTFEITNNLGDRITLLSGETQLRAGASTKAKQFQVQGVALVEPPTVNGTKASVSHLSSDTNHVFVGYKVVGGDFGGGIDIFDADDPAALGDNKITSIKSDQVDVQEVINKDTVNAPDDIPPLWVAGAQEPPGPLVKTPSVGLRLSLDFGGVDVTTRRLSGNVSKSVAQIPPTADADDLNFEIFFVADDGTIHRFDKDLENQFTQAVEFREWSSIAASVDGVFALSKSGEIWLSELDAGPENQNPPEKINDLEGSGINPNGIARLQSGRPENGCPFLFAALNTSGFRVLSGGGDEILLSISSGNYTSANMTNGGQFLFASQRNGAIDVFEYDPENQVFNDTPIKTIETTDFSGVSETSQVNQVIRAGDFLYAATSSGVLVMEVVSGSSPSGNGMKRAAKGRC